MTKRFQVGDLVISHAKTLWGVPVGKPALVIAVNDIGHVMLKAGTREWGDHIRNCKKVPE